MDVNVLRAKFARGVAEWFDMEFMPMDKLVHGVSFVPLHMYAQGDPTLVGNHCVVLGKERDGVYTGKLNFVGGKIEDKNMKYSGEDVAKVLFDEVYEELHLVLFPSLFGDMLLKVLTVPFGDGVSLVFVVHLVGISRGVWDKEHVARKQCNAPWKFVEFDCIEHVPLNGLMKRHDVSKYVRNLVAEVMPLAAMLRSKKGVHRREFMTAEVRNGGRVTVK